MKAEEPSDKCVKAQCLQSAGAEAGLRVMRACEEGKRVINNTLNLIRTHSVSCVASGRPVLGQA